MNRQCNNQRSRDFAKMSRRVCVEVTGRAGGADMMDVFADEEEQGVSGSRPKGTAHQGLFTKLSGQIAKSVTPRRVPAAKLISAQSGLCAKCRDVLIDPPARAKT